jgi:hypothetical protein
MDVMLKEALRLRELGFAMHWLRPNSKAPIEPGWPTAPVMNGDMLRQTYRTGYNLGFRPGRWSVVDGGEIVVLDIDVRGGAAYADEAYAVAKGLMKNKYVPTVISGSLVGQHQYLRMAVGSAPDKAATTLRTSDIWVLDGRIVAAGTPGARPAWAIELLSTGKNVVTPPSVHPDSLCRYTWAEEPAK